MGKSKQIRKCIYTPCLCDARCRTLNMIDSRLTDGQEIIGALADKLPLRRLKSVIQNQQSLGVQWLELQRAFPSRRSEGLAKYHGFGTLPCTPCTSSGHRDASQPPGLVSPCESAKVHRCLSKTAARQSFTETLHIFSVAHADGHSVVASPPLLPTDRRSASGNPRWG